MDINEFVRLAQCVKPQGIRRAVGASSIVLQCRIRKDGTAEFMRVKDKKELTEEQVVAYLNGKPGNAGNPRHVAPKAVVDKAVALYRERKARGDGGK